MPLRISLSSSEPWLYQKWLLVHYLSFQWRIVQLPRSFSNNWANWSIFWSHPPRRIRWRKTSIHINISRVIIRISSANPISGTYYLSFDTCFVIYMMLDNIDNVNHFWFNGFFNLLRSNYLLWFNLSQASNFIDKCQKFQHDVLYCVSLFTNRKLNVNSNIYPKYNGRNGHNSFSVK